jgi:replicative DNA helicase
VSDDPRTLETAEKAVLGSLMLHPRLVWDIDLSTRDFIDPSRGAVYGAIAELSQDGQAADPIVIESRLKGRYRITAEDILEFTNHVTVTSAITRHAQIVKAKAIEREVRRRCHEVLKSDAEGEELLAYAQKTLFELQVSGDAGDAKSAAEIVVDLMAELERRRKGEAPSGLSTSVDEFDHYLTLAPGGVLVIAGRPSMGKTALVRWLLMRVIGDLDRERALVFSTESHRDDFLLPYVSQLCGVNSRTIKHGSIGWEQASTVKEAAQKIKGWPLWVDDLHSDIADITRQVRRFKARHGITLVVLDHLQEVISRGRMKDMDVINAALTELRSVCREEPQTYLVIVSQLNRHVESRENKRPMISDLRASGKIEEVADAILLVYRAAYYFKEEDPSLLEAAWAKNRNGPTGKTEFAWDDAFGQVIGPRAMQVTGGASGEDYHAKYDR